jgi:hypothetical protein
MQLTPLKFVHKDLVLYTLTESLRGSSGDGGIEKCLRPGRVYFKLPFHNFGTGWTIRWPEDATYSFEICTQRPCAVHMD